MAPILAEPLGNPALERKGQAMFDCATRIGWLVDADTGEVLKRVASYCHGRFCPICAYRRARKVRAAVRLAVREMLKVWPDTRFVMLTLTCRNVQLDQLRERAREMALAFARLTKRVRWPAEGWWRFLEVTRGADGSAHPHYHILLAVPGSYFSHDGDSYVRVEEWAKLWQESLLADYQPVVDVRAVKPSRRTLRRVAGRRLPAAALRAEAVADAVAELAKYPLKMDDRLLEDPSWFRSLCVQMERLKAFVPGGRARAAMRAAVRQLKAEKEDARAAERDGRRVTMVWWQWTGGEYVRASADVEASMTKLYEARCYASDRDLAAKS